MKKYIFSVLMAAMAAFTFSSCEDVPEPYTMPSKPSTGGETTGTPSGTGTQADPYNCAGAIQFCKSLESDVESANDVYVKGKIQSIEEQFSASYGNCAVTLVDADGSTTFKVWRALYFDNKKWTAGGKELKVGDEVVFCGKVVNYKGNTPETVQNKSWLVSINGEGANGGNTPDTPAGVTISGTTVTLSSGATAGESAKIDLSTLGYADQQVVDKVTLTDGTTITFDANGETNAPKYYNGTKGIRVYKNNKIVFTGKSNIAKIILTCDSYNGTEYVGNKTATVTFSGKTATYTNIFTGTTGGGVQLRIKSIEIIYAK